MIETTASPPARTASPRNIARLIAVFSLLTVLGGVYAQGYAAERLIVWRDAAATAANFLAHPVLARSAVAVYLLEQVCSVISVALLYRLLKPAGPTLAVTGLCLAIVANVIKTMARVFFGAPSFVLGGTYVHGTSPEALHDLALVMLLVNNAAAGAAMVFYGAYALIEGVLIVRSRFLPRVLGYLSILGGIGWMANLWRPLWRVVGDYVLVFALVAVAVKIAWFLARGVNEQRWHERARSSGA